MIELIDDLPAGIVGISAHGTVHAADYTTVVGPAVDAALKAQDSLRLVYVMGDDFEGFSLGAMGQDAALGIDKAGRWDRIAVVTDTSWVIAAVDALSWLMSAHVRIFALAERAAAISWVSEQ